MHYYLDIQEQITNIMKKFTSNDLKHQSNDSNLTDIRDGSIYKEFSNLHHKFRFYVGCFCL